MRITEFQKKVYFAVQGIPAGHVSTYALVASAIGCRSARAVGQALRRNPFAPDVPCHRVISSDLTIGGFQGRREGASIARKLRLLRREGVYFSAGCLMDSAKVFVFPGGKKTFSRQSNSGRARSRSKR